MRNLISFEFVSKPPEQTQLGVQALNSDKTYCAFSVFFLFYFNASDY